MLWCSRRCSGWERWACFAASTSFVACGSSCLCRMFCTRPKIGREESTSRCPALPRSVGGHQTYGSTPHPSVLCKAALNGCGCLCSSSSRVQAAACHALLDFAPALIALLTPTHRFCFFAIAVGPPAWLFPSQAQRWLLLQALVQLGVQPRHGFSARPKHKDSRRRRRWRQQQQQRR